MAWDEEVGVVHRIKQNDIFYADLKPAGDGSEGVAAADGIKNRFWGNDEFDRFC